MMKTASVWCVVGLVVLVSAPCAFAAGSTFRYISPRPDATFVSKGTTLAFRPQEPSFESRAFPEIWVTGAASGPHEGDWVRADDGQTMVFRPRREFAPGERVSVSVGFGGEAELYDFTVSSSVGPDRGFAPTDDCLGEEWMGGTLSESVGLPRPAKASGVPAPFGFPNFQITLNASSDQGYVFIAPGTWLAILDNDGTFCYFAKRPTRVTDFKKSPSGNLTFIERDPLTPVPQVRAKGLIMDESYTVIDEYVAGNGYAVGTDFHEFTQLPNGNVILMVYDDEPVDMSQVVPGGNPNATVQGLILQELDASHNVVFEWRSWDHYEITDTFQSVTAGFIDYVHGNAVEVDSDGNWLVSCRNLSEVTKIDRDTGEIIWRLGGRNNQFQMTGSLFTRQHDVRRLPNGNLTVYDNGNDSDPQQSRAVEYELVETSTPTATQVWEFYHPDEIFSPFTGSARRLPNGNTFISWGNQQRQTEVDPGGTIVWEALGLGTYRAVRQTWSGAVAAAPTLWVEPNGEPANSATLHFTKFGDDTVAQYCIYRGESPESISLLDTTTGTSYVALDLQRGVAYYFSVTSKDAQGTESPYSNTELFYLEPVVPVLVTRFQATRGALGVDLAWEIPADARIEGFQLYRSEDERPPQMLNPAGPLASTSRSYRDTSARSFESYDYTLIVDLADGSTLQSQTRSIGSSRALLSLEPNRPNPFNPQTVISLTVPEGAFVDLGVFDLAGRRVRTLQRGKVEAGRLSVVWNGRNDADQPVASGVYFCRLSDGRQTLTRKMMLLQ